MLWPENILKFTKNARGGLHHSQDILAEKLYINQGLLEKNKCPTDLVSVDIKIARKPL